MGIRIRKIDNEVVALCEVESDEKPGDIYIDDATHYALAVKFSQDWDLGYCDDEIIIALMEQEKVRDAKEEHEKWLKENLCLIP